MTFFERPTADDPFVPGFGVTGSTHQASGWKPVLPKRARDGLEGRLGHDNVAVCCGERDKKKLGENDMGETVCLEHWQAGGFGFAFHESHEAALHRALEEQRKRKPRSVRR